MPDSELFDYDSAAAYLSITKRHLQSLVSRRNVPYVKLGALVRFRKCDLDNWLASLVHEPARAAER
jgi:excisionase family DNA binding protein